MSRSWSAIAFGALVALTSAAPAVAGCEGTSYGKGVTLTETTPVEAILDRPEEFVGKAVRVEGKVADVCEMAGCWLELRAGEGDRVLKVKVKDGEIVFPTSARGHQATAEGVVERLDMDRAQYVRQVRHVAEEQGKPFDEATVGEGPFRMYQVKGTGAEICGDAPPPAGS